EAASPIHNVGRSKLPARRDSSTGRDLVPPEAGQAFRAEDGEMKSILGRVSRFDAHHRLFWSTAAGVLTFFVLQSRMLAPTHWIASWDASALIYLSLAW